MILRFLNKIFPDLEELIDRSVCIIIISVILGFTFNMIRPNPLKLEYAKAMEDLRRKRRDTAQAVSHPIPTPLSAKIENTPIAQQQQAQKGSVGIMEIYVDEVYQLYSSGAAIFIDTRAPHEYHRGHIKGAILLPYEEFDTYYPQVKDLLPKSANIVTYCDGGSCELSIDLAQKLIENGYENVHAFWGGWVDWIDAKYPIEETYAD